jgi:cell division protein FtsL
MSAARGRERVRVVLQRDRPYLLALLALLILLAVMAIGPLHSYTAAAGQVDELVAARDQLSAEVAELERERERLDDPEHIELLAREQLGLVKPGEIPFVVVAPEPDLEQVGAPSQPPAGGSWVERVWRAVAKLWR